MIVCCDCGVETDDFYPYQRSYCRSCLIERVKVSRKKNWSRHQATRRLKLYGLSSEGFEALWADQNGVCAACGDPLVDVAVDHDHLTGRVRGLLCRFCNNALGFVRDDPDRLDALARYLR